MAKKTSRRVKRKTKADRDYLHWLHRQWCVGVDAIHGHRCMGPIQASHFRNMTGLGRKEPDSTCIPACRALHESYDQALGYFSGWSKEARKAWHQIQQYRMRTRYQATLDAAGLSEAGGR